MADKDLMPPPAPRPPKRFRPAPPPPPPPDTVLDEDEWLAKMEGIIERDFFPELAHLQNKVAWLEAIRSGDPERIRQTQLSIARHRHLHLHLPGTPPPSTDIEVPRMSLDAFLSRHTSEDNASFKEILERTNTKKRQRLAAAFLPAHTNTIPITTSNEPMLLLTSSTSSDLTAGSLPRSKQELETLFTTGPPPSINHGATRIQEKGDGSGRLQHQHQYNDDSVPSTSLETGSVSEASVAPAMAAEEDKYDILSTPSFHPGVDASPIMTWGEVEATPLRIEDGSGGGGGGGATQFRIRETPRREAKAHELAAKAGASLRKRQNGFVTGNITGPRGGSGSESGAGGVGMTPARAAALAALRRTTPSSKQSNRMQQNSANATPLSHAARKLAHQVKGKKGGGMGGGGGGGADVYSALRASFRGGHGGTPRVYARELNGWETPKIEFETDGGSENGGVGGERGGGGGGWTPTPQRHHHRHR